VSKLKVELVSDFNSPTGYSTHARDLITSLLAIERIDLSLRPNKADKATVELGDETEQVYRDLIAKSNRKPDVRIHFEIPNFYQFEEGVYTIGFTQWETSRIPWRPIDAQKSATWNWVERMNRCDEIWTSCEDAKLAFERTKVTSPVHVVPGPIDTDFFHPDREELKIRGLTVTNKGTMIPRSTRPKVVGFMGAWTKRKNIEDWLVWLKTQFAPKTVVGLLKTSIGTIGIGDQPKLISSRIKEIDNLCKHVTGADIHFICEKLTDEEVARFFMTPDLYVSFSRGEGLDLPTLQAMASGCLVMHTDWGATRDYLTNEVGFPLPFQFEPVYGMEYTPYWGDQWWARVNLQQATVKAGQIFETMDGNEKPYDREFYDEMRRKAREVVVRRSSIPAITELLDKRFKMIAMGLLKEEDVRF
jgi:glycosyltransferase involved in cell wall biosynthesis